MAQAAQASDQVQVTVDYLPAANPFHNAFADGTTLEEIRTGGMAFFGVKDRQERDTYHYWLEFGGQRLTDTSQTLGHLLGEHRRGAHFNLVEEITPGGASHS